MDKDILKRLKNTLEEEKNRLTKDLRFFAKKDPKIKGNWRTRFPFLGQSRQLQDSSADEVEEYAALLPIEHTLEIRLQEIDEALDKIKKGNYGKCENCHKEINPKRLMVNPEARTCLHCGQKNKK